MLTVYGAILSPYVRKVLLALEYKGIDYKSEQIFPGALPEGYKDISPLGKIPAIKDGDFCLADSTVINEYLEEKYSGQSLLPSSAESRAKARWIETYSSTAFASALLEPFFQKIVAPMRGLETNLDAIAKAEAVSIPRELDYVETLVGGAEFLFDDRISLADIALISPFMNAAIVQFQVDASRWPKTAAYVEFIFSQAVVQKRLAEEKALLGG